MVVTGVPGEKGDRGESVIGPRGKDGESAYDVAKQNGFKGTINE
jgi:streptomycin 6-kinase